MFAGQKNTLEVEIDLGVPRLLRHLDRTAGRRAADIVDENIDAAEAGDTGFDHRRDLLRIGDVAGVNREIGAGLLQAADGLVHLAHVAIDGKDFRAFLREQHAFGAAVAPARPDAARAGDECDLACETAWHCWAPVD